MKNIQQLWPSSISKVKDNYRKVYLNIILKIKNYFNKCEFHHKQPVTNRTLRCSHLVGLIFTSNLL